MDGVITQWCMVVQLLNLTCCCCCMTPTSAAGAGCTGPRSSSVDSSTAPALLTQASYRYCSSHGSEGVAVIRTVLWVCPSTIPLTCQLRPLCFPPVVSVPAHACTSLRCSRGSLARAAHPTFCLALDTLTAPLLLWAESCMPDCNLCTVPKQSLIRCAQFVCLNKCKKGYKTKFKLCAQL